MVGSGKILFLLGVVVVLEGLIAVKALAAEGDGKSRVIFEQKVIHKEPLKPAQSAQSISTQDEKAEGSEVLDACRGEKQDSNDTELMKRMMELLKKMLGLAEGNSEGDSKELIDQLSGQEKNDQKIDDDGFKDWNDHHEWKGIRNESR